MPHGPPRILVFLPPGTVVRRTVSRALRDADDLLPTAAEGVIVDVVAPTGTAGAVRQGIDAVRGVEGDDDRITVRVTTAALDAGDAFESAPDAPTGSDTVGIVVGPGPSAVVDAILGGAAERGWPVVCVDPSPRGRPLVRDGGRASRGLATFVVAFVFYLSLGRLSTFDVLTGAASAALVAVVLSGVTFVGGVSPRRTGGRLVRSVAYLPSLLRSVARANVHVAAVILDPRLPIDPTIERVETGAAGDLERAVLANSLTLTPGTLTVAVRGDEFHVHSLTAASRESLHRRSLERAVGYVFHGRGGSEGTDPPDGSERGGTG